MTHNCHTCLFGRWCGNPVRGPSPLSEATCPNWEFRYEKRD
nr:MAG TPA: hypothetical protein [Caudoviricetes sp.]